MKNLLKRYIIKVPKNILVFYCDTYKILIFSGIFGHKYLKIQTKIILFREENLIKITRFPLYKMSGNQKKKLKALQGTTVALIKQAILNVSIHLCKKLKLVGVGYKVFLINILNKKLLNLKLGYSHQIYFKIPEDFSILCLKSTKLFISGNSYTNVTLIAALIRSYKIPEPYKGKGILYENEKIIIKEGKKV